MYQIFPILETIQFQVLPRSDDNFFSKHFFLFVAEIFSILEMLHPNLFVLNKFIEIIC